jgi:HD-like signal output (HDOD) protein
MPALPSNLPHQPPRHVGAWVALWRDASAIPVQEATALELEQLRANEDAVDARLLVSTLGADPLMALKLLAYVCCHRPARLVTDTETLTASLVLLGIGPFFRAFAAQTSIEQHLAQHPLALQGLNGVLTRARRAAAFALGFAVHRMDPDAEVVHGAALLHDFAEMLLWCHCPTLALEIAQRQRCDPAARSAAVQREVLNAELADVQQALMRAWRLPELLVRISDDKHADTPQVRNVVLANRLARHTALGWGNPAVPDDVNDIAELLNLAPEPTMRLLLDLDQ